MPPGLWSSRPRPPQAQLRKEFIVTPRHEETTVKNFHIALIPADRSGTEFTAADRKTPDYMLNNVVERADINQSFEVYLDILERFYADDIEFFVDEPQHQIIGKGEVRVSS